MTRLPRGRNRDLDAAAGRLWPLGNSIGDQRNPLHEAGLKGRESGGQARGRGGNLGAVPEEHIEMLDLAPWVRSSAKPLLTSGNASPRRQKLVTGLHGLIPFAILPRWGSRVRISSSARDLLQLLEHGPTPAKAPKYWGLSWFSGWCQRDLRGCDWLTWLRIPERRETYLDAPKRSSRVAEV